MVSSQGLGEVSQEFVKNHSCHIFCRVKSAGHIFNWIPSNFNLVLKKTEFLLHRLEVVPAKLPAGCANTFCCETQFHLSFSFFLALWLLWKPSPIFLCLSFFPFAPLETCCAVLIYCWPRWTPIIWCYGLWRRIAWAVITQFGSAISLSSHSLALKYKTWYIAKTCLQCTR